MKINFKNKKGFTLIELLVTISIISLLSSIVLTTVSSARNKAKDAAIKQEVDAFVSLLNMEYSDNGSYDKLQGLFWINAGGLNCQTAFYKGSSYAEQAKKICQSIYDKAADNPDYATPGGFRIFLSTDSDYSKYTIMVYLNDGNWYCAGSSGVRAEHSSFEDLSPKGCYKNP